MQHLPQFQWTYLPLPARHFNWRIRGNSLTYAFAHPEKMNGNYDLVMATSMTDLSALRGFVPKLAEVPTILYFHENQFAYPQTSLQHSPVEAQMISIYSALCADSVVFNSRYNQQTFWQGAQQLLKKLPDGVPSELLESVRARDSVLPVPLFEKTGNIFERSHTNPLQVLWNHRWEYDKGPQRLLEIVEGLPEHWQMTWHIVGQQFRQQPEPFKQLHRVLSSRKWLGKWGFQRAEGDYQQLMQGCDLVLSTAHHDFQGLSVQEAVLSGCLPLVPDDLAYPEWFREPYRYNVLDQGDIQDKFAQWTRLKASGNLPPPPDLCALLWSRRHADYLQLIERTVADR